MSDTTTCERCERPARDQAYICDTCVSELDRVLGDVPAAVEEVVITMTRQKAAASGGGSASATRPLPWHDKAAEALRQLQFILVGWVRFCDEEAVRGRPQWMPTETPGDRARTMSEMSRWLMHTTQGLAFHDLGAKAVDEITDAVAECWRVVFWKKRSRIYLGRCERTVTTEDGAVVTLSCQGDVYAEEDDPVGLCVDCGQEVVVATRKADIDKRLDAHLCTAAEAAGFATYLDLGVDRDRIRKRINQWHSRARLLPARTEHHDDGTETVWFRWSEVRTLLATEYQRDTA